MTNIPASDPRVTDVLLLIVKAVVSALTEEQRAAAHAYCDACLSGPNLSAMIAADAEGEVLLRRIVDQVFTGFPPP